MIGYLVDHNLAKVMMIELVKQRFFILSSCQKEHCSLLICHRISENVDLVWVLALGRVSLHAIGHFRIGEDGD